ncbi:hypothetical protein [Lentzea aerocolonigenes]|uniref:hypothetical protein n=1 Tax=Lentzea aerocolonigenes TaxID=68170 RepID=UPI0004C455D9|nr:hypothetical protein [Lentzea aerocolonigenes]MCP2243939.1 hypothetical protein [Lentzea aerocolonigenes]
MARRRALYVEAVIRADLDELWRRTQDPHLHQRWDLRFGRIDYLPKAEPAAPQRFRYSVRVLPGLTVDGTGVSVGERTKPDGSRTSALRFASAHPLSLIRSGAGYWRYVPTSAGIRFLTGYDYQPGWGRLGALADRPFRLLLGWATAWSFDRLRLWLERGVPPEASLRRALLDAGARVAVCVVAWWAAPVVLAAVITLGVLLVPPSPSTPAARRCRRLPPDRRSSVAPSTLSTLEHP